MPQFIDPPPFADEAQVISPTWLILALGLTAGGLLALTNSELSFQASMIWVDFNWVRALLGLLALNTLALLVVMALQQRHMHRMQAELNTFNAWSNTHMGTNHKGARHGQGSASRKG